MFKIDDYIRFVNNRTNNMFLFLSQFIEMNTGKTVTVLMEEYLSINNGTVLNFMKKYAESINCNKSVERYVNVESFQTLCVRAKL